MKTNFVIDVLRNKSFPKHQTIKYRAINSLTCSAFMSLQQIIIGLRKVYPYYFTFTTFTKGRWVGEKILEVFGREFRAHPVEEYVSNHFIALNHKDFDFN